jgi:hypothetical protein
MRILWMAQIIAGGMFLFLIASHLAHVPDGQQMPPHLPEMLGALCIGMAIITVVLPARRLDAALRAMDVTFENEVGEPVGSFRESAPTTKLIAKPHDTMLAALARFQQPFMMSLSLAQSINLFGLFVGYYGAPPQAYAPFFALGLGLMVWRFPRLSMVTSALERVKGAKIRF